MNTNNISQGVTASAKKIALAGLVFLTAAVFTIVAMSGVKDKIPQVMAADPTDYATCIKAANAILSCNGSIPKCEIYIAGVKKEWPGTACANGCDLDGVNGKCTNKCTYDANNPKGIASGTGTSATTACAGANQYCTTNGVCKVGCKGYAKGGAGWQFYAPGTKTCSKPGFGLSEGEAASDAETKAEAKYTCQIAPQYNDQNKPAGQLFSVTVDNTFTSTSKITTPVYSLVAKDTDKCFNGSCFEQGPNNLSCTGGTTCTNKANAIKSVFAEYYQFKKAYPDKVKDINDNPDLDQQGKDDEIEKLKEDEKKVMVKMLTDKGIDQSSATAIMQTVEKMIYGSKKGLLWEQTNSGSLPTLKEGQEVKLEQIACQYLNREDVSNSWCPTNAEESFWGYSFACKESSSRVSGCQMYSWVDGAAEKCSDKNKDIDLKDAFITRKEGAGVYATGGNFDDGNGNSLSFDKEKGLVKGGAKYGCGYDSEVMASGYYQGNPVEYTEINKNFTGKCWGAGDAGIVTPEEVTPDNPMTGCNAPGSESEGSDSDATDAESGTAEKKYAEGDYICENGVPRLCNAGTWEKVDNETCSKEPDCIKKCEVKTDGTCASDTDCKTAGQVCVFENLEAEKGNCSNIGCYSPSNNERTFAKGAIVCQSETSDSLVCNAPSTCAEGRDCVSRTYWDTETPCEEGCDMESGKCNEDAGEDGGKCADISINKGEAQETTSSCGGETCEGVCVPFNVTETGNCESIACSVTNDYDKATTPAFQKGSKWYACMKPKSDSENTDDTRRGNNPETIDYTIKCTDKTSGQTDTAEGTCDFPAGDDNPYQKEEKEAEKEDEKGAEEGDKCEEDSDCEDGLICRDGKCAQEDAGKEGSDCETNSDCDDGLTCQEGKCVDKASTEAPTVTINSPTGTVTTKTAQLSVTTNMGAVCKYVDITNGGSFTASSFGGSGMTMASSGYTHVATINQLVNSGDNNSSDCKKSHNVVVLCQNAQAKDQNAVASIGSAQASFTVDLSGNTEYAPTVTSAMTGNQFSVANPVLKVTTNMPAKCQYKEGGAFTYGSGTDFGTSGSYSHNTELSGLTSKDYTYTVVCKDIDTCAANSGLEIKFKVALEGGDSDMTIANATAATQTVSNPTLSVTTDIPATCQYSTSSFSYGSGTQFTNDNDYSHTSSLTALADGTHTFYVVCKEKESGAVKVLAAPITTILERGGAGPVISNTTVVSQSTSSPVISITTVAAAKCQYSESSGFAYGSGTQFTTDGGTGHSVQLSNIEDGEHTYYVLCKDVASGEVNSEPVQIVFEVSNVAATCADLDSNDRESDENRDYDSEDSESKYAWRSVEDGERDTFTNVDWYAGYQFTPDENGYVTQLCGYFEGDQENEVILYNGSYKELAKTTVEGTDDWKCVSISPVAVKTDKRYYVVARVENGPIYYEYQSGLLPADADNVVIESGVRQLAEEDFGEDIFKYDYMVFGLVDVKIVFSGESEEGPEIEVEGPIGDIDENYTTLELSTNENATCKFSREDVEYSDMEYDFGATGQKTHSQKICKLDEGAFSFYARCKNEDGDENDASTLIQFEVSE